jgi:hypothetical protein
MIISSLPDPSVMNKKNFTEGYNVSTGEVDNHPANNKYGEVHTGDAWLPARDRYWQNKTDMPVRLIVLGDKLHTDLHGPLSLTPIIFAFTLFNCAARNDSKFWRPIGYIPNLGYAEKPPIRLTQEIKSKMSTLVCHSLFNHLKISTKKMSFNVLFWDIQCVSEFGFIILLEIPKATINGWVNILGIERV